LDRRQRRSKENNRPRPGFALDVALLNRDVRKSKDSSRAPRQTASATGSVEQREGGVRVGDGQRYTGEPDPRTNVEHSARRRPPHARKHQGIGQMAVDDAGGLEWAHTTSCDPLVRQPSAELTEHPPLGRIELQSGPPRRPIQLVVELFPVKHAA
jgi:hypothetical protein